MILKLGSKGQEVKALQEKLIKLGYDIGKYGADGAFGSFTEKAVKEFQANQGILVDGEVGNDTLHRLDIALGLVKPEEPVTPKAGLSGKALEIAKTQLNVREQPPGSNKGKDVEKYLASIGLGGGYSWCMAFVYWNVNEAAKALNVQNPLYKTGGVLMQWNQRQNLKVSTPKAGDIFIMDFGKGTGHTGFVESVEGNYINTVEGNTNAAGSRNGDGVYRRKRAISSIKGFLRVGA